jgi:hypothetical protein
MSRLPYFLDNRFTDDDQVTASAAHCTQEDSWYSFLLEVESTQGHAAAGRIISSEKSNDIGNWNYDLPTCSIVPQPTTLPRALISIGQLNWEKHVKNFVMKNMMTWILHRMERMSYEWIMNWKASTRKQLLSILLKVAEENWGTR